MKLDLIKTYISRLKKDDIKVYLNKENIPYNDNEVNLIYEAIMSNYKSLENINFEKYISNYKLNLNPTLYNKIIEKYNEYKKFIE